MVKAKLLAFLMVCVLVTMLVLPLPVYAQEPIKLDADTVLLEEAIGYDVYYNSKTKEYQFQRNSIWFWESDIPEEYRPTDPAILKALDEAGMNKNKVHIKRDYSADHPTAITYMEYGTDNLVTLITGLPMVDADGDKLRAGWFKSDNDYYSNSIDKTFNNLFWSKVSDGQVTFMTYDGNQVVWNPQLFLSGKEIRAPPSPIILSIDPTNSNYSYSVLEWDYGVVKRQIRLIEGSLFERWVVESNPYSEIRVKHNSIGSLPLGLSGAWDAEGNPLARIEGDEEIVSAEEFDKAVYPVTIGATLTVYPVANATEDGDVYHQDLAGLTWNNIVSAAGSGADDGSVTRDFAMFRCDGDVNEYDMLGRSIFLFDTSPLGASAMITAAVFSLFGDKKDDDGGVTPSLNVYASNPANNNALVAADYATLAAVAFCDAPIAYGAYSIIAYNDFTLNANGRAAISKTGVTKLGARLVCDATSADPGWSAGVDKSRFNGHFTEKGAGFKPKLVITYTAPPVVTSGAATAVEETSATFHGNVTSTGSNPTVDERGFVYDTSTHADPGNVAPGASGYASSWADAGGPWGTGVFDSGANVVGLTEGDQYFFRAYTHNTDVGYDYSNTEQTFLTKPVEPTNLAAVVSGAGEVGLTWNTGAGFDQTRIRRKTGAYPVNELDGTLVYTAGGTSHTDTGLLGGVTYYYRAWSWCTEGGLERYSDTYSQANVMALSAPITICWIPWDATPPSMTEMYYSANVTSLGGFANYIQRGFVWGTVSIPANPGDVAPGASGYPNNWTETGTWAVIGDYDYDATGLLEGTTYYIRACAQNSTYWGYSPEKTFDTYNQVKWYQPNAIIAGTVLPDREGIQNGVINWGANPAGITVVVGSLAEFGAVPTTPSIPVTPDVVGEFLPPGADAGSMFPDEETTALPGMEWSDWLSPTADITDTPIQFFWWILGIIGVLAAVVLTQYYLNNLFLAGLAGVAVMGVCIGMGMFPFWFIITAVVALAFAATMERKPSL